MSRLSSSSSVIAVLGPTNTGKTHLAVQRMCSYTSGVIGFPLRLLAREVYDRVVEIKGADRVALITGEEKILPEKAQYFLCTAESMPMNRDFAFAALDEVQLGCDRERGHVFTDRLLNLRGREETMFLGSDALRPLLRRLIPGIEIVSRPRFSTLSYSGPTKLSRLPPRSAIVAFSAEEVYATAEMLRRLRGGAAVVMGALSPRTRNAQVEMFQAGEVNYLVATDAIGMGLNMDVTHVAFASLSKFDGRQVRRLTIPEMAQIAGRAGRYQRDGSFGVLQWPGETLEFREEEVSAIEEHHFSPAEYLYWREGQPDVSRLDALIASLERKPGLPLLRAAPESYDLAVLHKLAEDPVIKDRARSSLAVKRLWAVCGLPDFRKTGIEAHSRLVRRIFGYLTEGNGYLPVSWFADEIVKLDNVQGDVPTLSERLAGIRIWAYIAHRSDWLENPAKWAERTRALEEKLSDALHERLTQRFVDRRTSILMQDMGKAALDMLPTEFSEDGVVLVGGESIGRLDGFSFHVDPAARHGDMKRLHAAAERRLGGELTRRAKALQEDEDKAFSLLTAKGEKIGISWRGYPIADLERGKSFLTPRVKLSRKLDRLSPIDQKQIEERLVTWLKGNIQQTLGSLVKLAELSELSTTPPSLRALLASLVEKGGCLPRVEIDDILKMLNRPLKKQAAVLGIRFGRLDIFMPALLKPKAIDWRLALLAVFHNRLLSFIPKNRGSAIETPLESDAAEMAGWVGFRSLGSQMLRVDSAEKLATMVHDRRPSQKMDKNAVHNKIDPSHPSSGQKTERKVASPLSKRVKKKADDSAMEAVKKDTMRKVKMAGSLPIPAKKQPKKGDQKKKEKIPQSQGNTLRQPSFAPDQRMMQAMGLKADAFAKLMLKLGFYPADKKQKKDSSIKEDKPQWVWRGVKRGSQRRRASFKKQPDIPNAFSVLAHLKK
ncbi:helicase-related protein [Zymomonas mobilis]|uniref:Helicase domain protein n=1 Tax=Zymomonas mobilis subsp. mobilis (strain ATCC 10988 / DSM 424 / LMG 404 / NCIMB 8938 / NRRL B-806 / ZM1) TaxID=555217 RepID=A0A0H3FY23_ZYMMA|nr:helicase-related protein [Zymomonas mobilis]AEH62621.1 helicase domain protein [Zymomonas mobilis subsp. mobilis ATCC 10988]TQL27776.1 ATP-dependent RNA helicase SUPV3L1/SUV3 [Zymomonas mobilis]TQL29715.1 ATP-dependent RNA helicase SUPV3L1/SUV3 [Zymomonas mobilis]